MYNIVEEIRYTKNHLDSKEELTQDEMFRWVLYDMYLRMIQGNEVEKEVKEINLPLLVEEQLPKDTNTEFNDILPKLVAYEKAKEQYFKGDKSADLVELARDMLREIIEFLQAIKSNADTEDERNLIDKAFGIIGGL